METERKTSNIRMIIKNHNFYAQQYNQIEFIAIQIGLIKKLA